MGLLNCSCVFLIVLTRLSDCKGFREVFAHRADPSGVGFSEYLLFQFNVNTTRSCALRCIMTPGCKSFTFSKVTPWQKCRGHSEVMLFSDTQFSATGTRLYAFKEKSAWRDKACSSDADCMTDAASSHVQCFQQKCLCTPGYFYWENYNTCIRDCPDSALTSNFMEYPEAGMTNHNDGWLLGSLAACEQGCISATSYTCRGIERDYFGNCYLSRATGLTHPVDWVEDAIGWIWYQRTCQ